MDYSLLLTDPCAKQRAHDSCLSSVMCRLAWQLQKDCQLLKE